MSRRRRPMAVGRVSVRDGPDPNRKRRPIVSEFDAAKTTPLNRQHWLEADNLSADDAANPEVRKTLRERARYEIQNNSIARGINLTLANDMIGTGPRWRRAGKMEPVRASKTDPPGVKGRRL